MEQCNPLSASVIGSFAYTTVKDRLPVILTRVIDYLCREKLAIVAQYGEVSAAELKEVIAKMSQLKNGMQTNKPLQPFDELTPVPPHDDTDVWNSCITEYSSCGSSPPTWFTAPWLLVECYMYKRIHHCFQQTTSLKELDPFLAEKQLSLKASREAVERLQHYTLALLKTLPGEQQIQDQAISNLLQLSVWGNQCDLSLSGGRAVGADEGTTTTNNNSDTTTTTTDPVVSISIADTTCQKSVTITSTDNEDGLVNTTTNITGTTSGGGLASSCEISSLLSSKRSHLLVNDSARLCQLLQLRRLDDRHVALILDNAGYELLTDVCLSLVLLKSGLASSVEVHVKTRPWFVSDTLSTDIQHTLHWLSQEGLSGLAQVWLEAMQSGRWRVKEHSYWTTPHTFPDMHTHCPDLYAQLASAKLIIFKGDLNYRKLVSDLNWPTHTALSTAMGPSLASLGPILALRTVKGGPAVGLGKGVVERAVEQEGGQQWAINGEWGMIQLHWPGPQGDQL